MSAVNGSGLVGLPAITRLAVAGCLSLAASIQWTSEAFAQSKPAAATPQPARVQPLLRGSFVATMDEEYRKIDANKDGAVSKAELQADHERRAVAAATANARALFARFDLDRNGQLSAEEFIKASIGQPKKPDVTSVMARLDTDRDSKVTIIEYRALTLAAFDRLDKDNDSVLSEAEQRAGGFIR